MERTTYLRRSEVEAHNTPSSCWIVINNYVYDITAYGNDHPGGPEILRQHGGKDATESFLTKGNSGHSSRAVAMLKKFLVGELHPKDCTRVVNTYSIEEIAKHRSEGDYWFAVHNKVYNVSAFLGEHPGGMEPLKMHSGTDASKAFDEVGHTHDAKNKLKRLYVGELHPKDCEAVSAAAQAKYVAPSMRDPVAVRGPDPVKQHVQKQVFGFAVLLVFLYCLYLMIVG